MSKDKQITMDEFNQSQPQQTTKDIVSKWLAELPEQIILNQLLAKLTREKYLALVKEGFGTDQALFLCKQ